jgi:hypothetical protein
MYAKFTRKDFLEAIFSSYYKEHRGFILVKSVKRGDPKMSTRYFPNIEILAKEHYGEERDVYFGICPRERMKAEKEHVHYAVAVWADLDIGPDGHEEKSRVFEGPQHAAKAIRSFPKPPSIIVESGRGAHLYWLLKNVTEVNDPERVEKVLRNISDHLGCDTDINLDTVLRLPETVNTKIPGKPVNCDVKFINANFRYSIQDFENLGIKPSTTVVRAASGAASTPKPHAAAEAPGFSDEPPAYEPSTPLHQNLDDSLVLDETIIDELIDDISMTASNVADMAPSVTRAAAAMSVPLSSVTEAGHYRNVSAPSISSSVLHKLSTERAEVEISLIGTNTTINGTLVWNENGLIGVEAGGDQYTIPLTSISFIRNALS